MSYRRATGASPSVEVAAYSSALPVEDCLCEGSPRPFRSRREAKLSLRPASVFTIFCFALYEALRFRAKTQRPAKGPTAPGLALWDIAWPKRIAGRRHSPPTATAPASHGLMAYGFGTPKDLWEVQLPIIFNIQLSRPLRFAGLPVSEEAPPAGAFPPVAHSQKTPPKTPNDKRNYQLPNGPAATR